MCGRMKCRGITSPHLRGKGSAPSSAGGPNAASPDILTPGHFCKRQKDSRTLLSVPNPKSVYLTTHETLPDPNFVGITKYPPVLKPVSNLFQTSSQTCFKVLMMSSDRCPAILADML